MVLWPSLFLCVLFLIDACTQNLNNVKDTGVTLVERRRPDAYYGFGPRPAAKRSVYFRCGSAAQLY